MKHKAARIALTAVVLVGAFGALLYTTLSEGAEYYKHVDEVMDEYSWVATSQRVH